MNGLQTVHAKVVHVFCAGSMLRCHELPTNPSTGFVLDHEISQSKNLGAGCIPDVCLPWGSTACLVTNG
jgi:hypothetical protein